MCSSDLATLVVYHSKKDLTPGAWWLRTVLHAILLEVVLLPIAHHWGFWYGRKDAIIYAAFILAAKIVWHLVDFEQCIRNAAEVNEKLLKRRRNEETNGE